MKLGIPKAEVPEVDKLEAVRAMAEGSVPHTMLVLIYDSIKKHGVTEVLTDMLGDEELPCELSCEGIEAWVEENKDQFAPAKTEEELEAERVANLSPEEKEAEEKATALTAAQTTLEEAQAAVETATTNATEARAAVEGAEDTEAAEQAAVEAETAVTAATEAVTTAQEALAALQGEQKPEGE